MSFSNKKEKFRVEVPLGIFLKEHFISFLLPDSLMISSACIRARAGCCLPRKINDRQVMFWQVSW